MKKHYLILGMILTGALFLLASCGSQSQDTDGETEAAKKVDPVTVFENEYAAVVAVTLQPGEELASHPGQDRLIYSLSDYAIDWVERGIDEGTKRWQRGDVHTHRAGEHAATNNGSTPAEWVAFARKDASLPPCEGFTLDNDVTTVAADKAQRLLDDAQFRVTEVRLAPGESIPTHDGINRIIYSLSEYTLSYESNTEGNSETAFQRGDAHWHEGCKHSLENVGDTEAHFLVVSYK